MIYEDQLAAIQQDSATHGTTGGDFDLALLTDGLQGRARAGHHDRRRLPLLLHRQAQVHHRRHARATSSTPATWPPAPSTADLAIILIDARHGVLTQTKRHTFIVSLLGIKHVIVAINKMDLVDYSEEVYEKIKHDYREFAARLDMPDLHFIPHLGAQGRQRRRHRARTCRGTTARR